MNAQVMVFVLQMAAHAITHGVAQTVQVIKGIIAIEPSWRTFRYTIASVWTALSVAIHVISPFVITIVLGKENAIKQLVYANVIRGIMEQIAVS